VIGRSSKLGGFSLAELHMRSFFVPEKTPNQSSGRMKLIGSVKEGDSVCRKMAKIKSKSTCTEAQTNEGWDLSLKYEVRSTKYNSFVVYYEVLLGCVIKYFFHSTPLNY